MEWGEGGGNSGVEWGRGGGIGSLSCMSPSD